jgi:hypothetical protein
VSTGGDSEDLEDAEDIGDWPFSWRVSSLHVFGQLSENCEFIIRFIFLATF